MAMIAGWLACGGAAAVQADPPVGSFTVELGGAESVYRIPKRTVLGDVPASARCAGLKGRADGRYQAQCEIRIREGGVRGELAGPVTVELSTENGDATVVARLRMSGQVRADGEEAAVTARARGSAFIPDGAGSVSFDFAVKVCLRADGRRLCESESGSVQLELATGGGDWSLAMDVAERRHGRIRGTAVATVGGKSLSYDVSGSLDEETGLYKLRLKPSSKSAEGSKLKIVNVDVQENTLTGELKYRIYGQSGQGVPITVTLTPPSP